ncbi:MAG: flagellar filament capping protein FliD [Tepidimonas sp.]|uniref:flagellar filament capping protein FliD n=1 Tax=Tepidimonas sp. TaxID=2002775 RepID=UPI00259E95BB|nr:flagellar filament capping protein FliD [Tepidimonas sp.]MDM7456728.1 flagellar filament capping protein FliD [Tepidimonas sp.]
MAISSPGVGSGLDVNSVISQLLAIERKPIQQIQTQISSLQSSISSWGQIKAGLAKLQDAAAKLSDANFWRSMNVKSSNEDVVTARSSGSPLVQDLSVRVLSLAQAQATRSASLATSGPLGMSGRLDLSTGSWSGGNFNPSGTPISVNISASDTVDDIATKVNQANAGITAVVVRGAGQSQLVFKSSQTGAVNGFEIKTYDSSNNLIDDGVTGLGALSYFNNGSGIVGQALSYAAQDATIEIDGVNVTSATNTFGDAIAGLTIEAKSVSTSPINISVAADKAAITDAVQAFQKAFSDLSKTIRELTRSDPTGQNSGPLRGDQAALGLLSMLRNHASNTVPGSGIVSLADIGLSFDKNGNLSLDSNQLNSSLTDVDQVSQLFLSSGAGIADNIKTFIQGALSIEGSVSIRENTLKESIARKNKEISGIEERTSRTEQRLRAQYTALDVKMAQYNGLSNYISQQLGAWNKK